MPISLHNKESSFIHSFIHSSYSSSSSSPPPPPPPSLPPPPPPPPSPSSSSPPPPLPPPPPPSSSFSSSSPPFFVIFVSLFVLLSVPSYHSTGDKLYWDAVTKGNDLDTSKPHIARPRRPQDTRIYGLSGTSRGGEGWRERGRERGRRRQKEGG